MKSVLFKAAALCLAAPMFFASCGSSSDDAAVAGTLTDPLDQSSWSCSEWISAADAPVIDINIGSGYKENGRAADGASWFVSTLENDGKVVSAKWMTSGLGVYEIYVGGKLIGEEILKPGFTHAQKTKIAFTYDVTAAMNKNKGAKNVFAAQVTPGWWADKIVTPGGHDGIVGKKCAFRGVLELTFADGSKKCYGTNATDWKAGIAGPVKHSDIFDGIIYDARIAPGYDTPEILGTPEINREFNGKIFPTDGAEIYLRRDIALDPVEAYCWNGVEGEKDGEFGKVVRTATFAAGEEIVVKPGETLVVDFGQNSSAVPEFVFKAAEGTTLNCLPAEILNDGNGAKSRGMDGPGGSCHRTNLRIPKYGMSIDYTFAGKGYESFLPRTTFFGYRYVSLTASAEVRIRSIRSIPVTSISKDIEIGTITTGDESVNKLISNTIWGQRSNYLSVPTDCPQRNERLGWTADTQVFSETGTFFANTDRFFHKWMRDMRDSQSSTGGFPGVAPTAQYGNDMMRVGWADAGIIVPWTIWKQFGDKAIVDENWAAMDKFLTHVEETKYDHNANVAENHNYQWADWLSYSPLESRPKGDENVDPYFAFTIGKDGKRTPKPDAVIWWNYLCASYWAIDAAMMRDMAVATGRDAAKYETSLAKAKAYLKTFMNADGTFKLAVLNTMQSPALFALKNGLVEGKAKENLIKRLRATFDASEGCLQTGFLGTSIIMETLTANGMEDIAWNLLFQRKNPSWLYSVDNGATTIWERWNSYTFEFGMGPKGMNSFNHYAYGCVCQWLWERVAGIAADPNAPGFKHIIMNPVVDERLGFVKAEYNSAAGLIKSAWKFEGGKFVWEFTIPDGATASVTLPGEFEAKEYAAGTYRIEK